MRIAHYVFSSTYFQEQGSVLQSRCKCVTKCRIDMGWGCHCPPLSRVTHCDSRPPGWRMSLMHNFTENFLKDLTQMEKCKTFVAAAFCQNSQFIRSESENCLLSSKHKSERTGSIFICHHEQSRAEHLATWDYKALESHPAAAGDTASKYWGETGAGDHETQ